MLHFMTFNFALWNVARATLISELLNVLLTRLVWILERELQSEMPRRYKLTRTAGNWAMTEGFTALCDAAEDAMFNAILSNRSHDLHQLLPPVKNFNYNLRPSAHTRELPPANTKTVKRNFIYCMLYLNMY